MPKSIESPVAQEIIDELVPEWLKSTDPETALKDFAAYIEALGDMMWTTEGVREDSWQVIGRHLCFMAMDVGKFLERKKAAAPRSTTND